MSETAEKTDPKLWEEVKARVLAGEKGGRQGEWSARKAQLAVTEYKKAGGGYVGTKDPHNHLVEWTKEDWGTKSGRDSEETGERYLPKAAREALSDEEYKRSTAKKRADQRDGRQFSAQPADVAKKVARARSGGTKADLMQQARKQGIKGRSTMTKAQLEAALR
jgi:hypothetical protein